MKHVGKLLLTLAWVWTAAGGLAVAPVAAEPSPDPPVLTAVIPYEERLDVRGCAPYRGEGVLGLTLTTRGRFELATEVGVLRGWLEVPSPRRIWHLVFDEASLTLLAEYLRAGASAVCETPATLHGAEIRSARLRVQPHRGALGVRLEVETWGATSRPGQTTRLRHRLRGRGEVQLLSVPERPSPPAGRGGVTVIRPSRV